MKVFPSINHGTFFCRIIMQDGVRKIKVFNQPDDGTIMDNFINENAVWMLVVYEATKARAERIFICSFGIRLGLGGFYSLTGASVN
jgi:hypothetical protein